MRGFVSIALAVSVLALAGCGDSEQSTGSDQPSRPTGRALTQSQVMALHLGTPRSRVLAQVGPPSATGPKSVAGDSCLYWRIAEQPPIALWRLCFRNGRLHIYATYLTEANE